MDTPPNSPAPKLPTLREQREAKRKKEEKLFKEYFNFGAELVDR